MKGHNVATLSRGVVERQGAYLVDFLSRQKPFLGWLVAEDVPLSTVSPVVITKYFTGIAAWKANKATLQEI
jgi:hypothetical protein